MGAADDVGFSLGARTDQVEGEIVAVTNDVLVAEHNPRRFLELLYRSKPLNWFDDCPIYCGTCAIALAHRSPSIDIPVVDFVRKSFSWKATTEYNVLNSITTSSSTSQQKSKPLSHHKHQSKHQSLSKTC